MFRFLLGVLILASNFLVGSWAIAATCQPITTLQELRDMGATGNYCLANDIDASPTSTNPFIPIGIDNIAFIGVFDGNNHIIDHLIINSAARDVGLFGFTRGSISNVGLTNVSVAGTTPASNVGALAGVNYGIITSSYVVGGSVTGTPPQSSGGGFNSGSTGGLVGVNAQSITTSFTDVSVTGRGSGEIGGLVGNNGGTISGSYSKGSTKVDGTAGLISFEGGFVGANIHGTISDSYATGSVTGGLLLSDYLGGFAGRNLGNITQSYATGLVSGRPPSVFVKVGGFVGLEQGSTINSYWDTESSGQSSSSGGTGLTTAQLKAGLPSGFDPAVWGIVPAITYPYLLWQIIPPVAVNESATTPANTPVTIDLTAGASGNPTSAALVGTPVGGTVSGFPATTVTFTPTTGFSGAASFQFTLANAFGMSNTATATITVTPGPAPSISSVSPNPVTGSNSAQPFTINGANFVSGANVTLRDLTAGQTFANRPASSFSSTQIVINPIFTTAAHNWSVEVINPSGQNSGQFPFPVIAPPTPVLSVTPATLPVGSAAGTASFNVSNTGGGTMSYTASVSSGSPWLTITSGGSGGNSGTINVHYDVNNTGALRPGTIQVSANGATGSPAMVTITQAAGSAPTVAVYLVDPFLLNPFQTNLENIDLRPLYQAQNWPDVEAKGLVADNTSAAIAVIQTNDCTNNVSLTTTNGTTLLPFLHNENYLTHAPTTGGTQSLTIPAADLLKVGASCYAAALVQAPAAGASYSLSYRNPINPTIVFHPITVTAVQGSRQPPPAKMKLVIPPVVLVHGIWGNKTSLKRYEDNLGTYDQWKLYPLGKGIQSIQYQNDIAFDDSRLQVGPLQGGPPTLMKTIASLWPVLDNQHIVGGRVDVVAHSMGGLVARALAGQQVYQEPLRGRRQGLIHQIITLDTPEKGTNLAAFLFVNRGLTYQNLDAGEVPAVWLLGCHSVTVTAEKCFDMMGKNITKGAVKSLEPGNPCLTLIPGTPCLTNVARPADPKWIWNAISAVVPQTRGNGVNALPSSACSL